jgi:hypothetical protein
MKMGFKILYVEDLKPDTYISELEARGFSVTHVDPDKFEDLIRAIDSYQLLLLDFRLTSKTAIFDAPTIAQTLRTKNSKNHLDIPIVLLSNEKKISDYYKDLTSQDLFDFSIAKDHFLGNVDKYSIRFQSLISAYDQVKKNNFNINSTLGISQEQSAQLDYRIKEKLKNDVFGDDIFAFSSFILNNLIKSIGPLIGEDVISARLGISKSSPDWQALISLFSKFKYSGIFSDSYNRWWSEELLRWWQVTSDGKSNLRRLNAEQRFDAIKKITKLDLILQPKLDYAKSSSFWTICQDTKRPIDPADGLELNRRELLAWQEAEYISVKAALSPDTYDAQSQPLFLKYIKPQDKKRLSELANKQ